MEFYDKKEKTIEKQEIKEENKDKKVKEYKEKNTNKNKVLIISFVSISLLLVVLFCCTIFSLLNINNTKIIKGISINKINIEGMSKDEALITIKEKIEKELEKDINIKSEEFEYSIKLSQIELEYNINEAIENAYKVGRNGNIFTNNFNILKSMIKGENIDLEYSYNEELLNSITKDISVKIPGAVEEPSYYVENEKLYISKGKSGNIVNQEKLKDAILENIGKDKSEDILLEIYEAEPKAIDIEKIYNEVHTEPKNAYYTKNPFEVFPHVNGIDFNIENAKELLKEDKDEYEIILIITEPEITTNEIGTEAFPNLISSFSTKYDTSNIPRTTNLKLAMQKLNGYVVSPGETFSYNKALGKRTVAAGYKEAGGYAGGRVVQTLAGGICQISSTLYDAVVYANLDIIERHNHMFLAGYVGAGKDATVVYGSLDFKFKNTRNYPIMIKTSIGGGIAKISIYGVKEEVEYDVEISTKILSYIPYRVIYEEDRSLAEGEEKVTQGGMNGCKSITYKILRLNGKEVSRIVLSSDTYDPMNKIIKRGPIKTVETNTTPTVPEKKPTNTQTEEKTSVVPEQPEILEEQPEEEQPQAPIEQPNTEQTEKPEESPTIEQPLPDKDKSDASESEEGMLSTPEENGENIQQD